MTTRTHRVTHDPSHPDFPHGQPKGYSRNCRCDRCERAEARRRKRRRLDSIQRGNTDPYATPAERARVTRHVADTLAAVPGATMRAFLNVAGLAPGTEPGLRGRRRITRRTAAKALSVTVDKLAAEAAFVPVRDLQKVARTLQALGYSLLWQERQAGVDLRCIVDNLDGLTPATKYAAMTALAASIGDTPAVPGVHGSARSITYSQQTARGLGFYPPIFYNEDGTLDWRAIPSHPWAKDHDKAHRRIDLLRAVVEHDGVDLTRPQIAELTGETVREVERVVERCKIGLSQPRRPKRVAWLAAQLDVFAEDSDYDPVRFVLDVGLFEPTRFALDHPGVLAWRADHPDYQDQYERRAAARAAALAAAEAELDLSCDEQVAA